MGRPKTKLSKIIVTDLSTNIKTNYTTQAEVAIALKCSQASVSYAILNNTLLVMRYTVKYIQ